MGRRVVTTERDNTPEEYVSPYFSESSIASELLTPTNNASPVHLTPKRPRSGIRETSGVSEINIVSAKPTCGEFLADLREVLFHVRSLGTLSGSPFGESIALLRGHLCSIQR